MPLGLSAAVQDETAGNRRITPARPLGLRRCASQQPCFAARNRVAGRTIRLRLLARGRARGPYAVTIRARPVGAPAQTIRLTAIRG
jgi:hypothetical protein